MDADIVPPCDDDCCLDDSDTCLKCFYTLEESLRWHYASLEGRRLLAKLAAERRELLATGNALAG